MVIFRVGEKLHLNSIMGNGWLQYIFTVLWVLAGAALFAVVMQKIFNIIENKIIVRKE